MDAVTALIFMGVIASVSADDPTTTTLRPEERSYIFTVIKTEPYLRVREGKTGNEQFEGFIPSFLKALKDRKAIPSDYKMQLVKDGRYGFFDSTEGRWVGMIGEVIVQSPKKNSVADLAAAPIQVTVMRSQVVDFSKVWANITLALVTHKDNELNSVEDVLNSEFTLGGVEGGSSLQAISKQYELPYTTMWGKIESDPDSKVVDAAAAVDRARRGNYTVVLESQFADYTVNKHCELKMIETKLSVQGYAFALTKDSPLKAELDKGIQTMIDDGSLDRLRRQHWNVPCVSGQPAVLRGLSPVAMLAVVACAFLPRSS